MWKSKNTIRRASSTKPVTGVVVSSKRGIDEMKEKYPNLNKVFYTTDKKEKMTCFDNLLCAQWIGDESDLSKSLRIAKNTDNVPISFNAKIRIVSCQNINSKFPVIQLYPTDDESLYDVESGIPTFEEFISGKISNAVQIGQKYHLPQNMHEIYQDKIISIHLGFIFMCLNEMYRNPSDDCILNTMMMLQRSLCNYQTRNYIKSKEYAYSKIIDQGVDATKLKSLFDGRAGVQTVANDFVHFKRKTPYHEFIKSYYCLLIEHPEYSEKSVGLPLWETILGLLAQPLALDNNARVTYSGIEEIIVKIILERAFKHISSINVSSLNNMEDAIKLLHKKAGKRVLSELKFWGFMLGSATCLSQQCISKNLMKNLLTAMQNEIVKIEELQTIIALISPSASNYITDETLAEFIFIACTKFGKKESLGLEMFVTATKATQLRKTIEKNQGCFLDEQKRAEETVEELNKSDNDFKKFIKDTIVGGDHIRTSGVVTKFYNATFEIFKKGDIKLLEKLVKDLSELDPKLAQPIGNKKMRAYINHILIRKLPYEEAKRWANCLFPHCNFHETEQTLPKFMKRSNIIFNEIDEEQFLHPSDEEKGIEIKFCPLPECIAKAEKIRLTLENGVKFALSEMECPICLDNFDSKDMRKLHDVHPQYYLTCNTCSDIIMSSKKPSCPYCREAL